MNARFVMLAAIGSIATLAGCSSMGVSSQNGLSSSDRSTVGRIVGTSKAGLNRLVECGSNDVITLTPVAPEVEEFITASFGNAEEGAVRYSSDPNDEASSEQSLPSDVGIANCRDGWFAFENVPPGDYFVVSYLQNFSADRGPVFTSEAGIVDGGAPGAGFTAVSMMQRVTVTSGRKSTVHLRPTNAIDFSETEMARR